jgi:hypothetical protein
MRLLQARLLLLLRRLALRIIGLVCFVVMGCVLPVLGQSTPSSPATQTPVFMPLDALAPPPASTTATTTVASVVLNKEPLLAAGLSLVLPGAGQWYVESYFKAPLFAVAAVGVGYSALDMNRQYNDARQQYDAFMALDSLTRLVRSQEGTTLLRRREFYNDWRDTFLAVYLGIMLVSAVDAYTGAHLYDFDVSDDFKATVHLSPVRVDFAIRGDFLGLFSHTHEARRAADTAIPQPTHHTVFHDVFHDVLHNGSPFRRAHPPSAW